MNLRAYVYAVFAVVGLVVPWTFNLRFIEEAASIEGNPVLAFIEGGYVNNASSSFTADLFIGASAFLIFMISEARRLGMRHLWAYIVLFYAGAFASAAPLFLMMRERKLLAQADGHT